MGKQFRRIQHAHPWRFIENGASDDADILRHIHERRIGLLELREEAMVMCTKNNFELGYVNGTLGRVINFDRTDGFPIIETSDGRKLKIEPQTWSIEEDGKILAQIISIGRFNQRF